MATFFASFHFDKGDPQMKKKIGNEMENKSWPSYKRNTHTLTDRPVDTSE